MSRQLDALAKLEIKTVFENSKTYNLSFTAAHISTTLRQNNSWAGTFGHSEVAKEVRNLWRAYTEKGGKYALTKLNIDGYDVNVMHPNWMGIHPDHAVALHVELPRRVDLALFNNTLPTLAPSSPRRHLLPQRAVVTGDVVVLKFSEQAGLIEFPPHLVQHLGWVKGDVLTLDGTADSGECSLRMNSGKETVATIVANTLSLLDGDLMSFGVGHKDEVRVVVGVDSLLIMEG